MKTGPAAAALFLFAASIVILVPGCKPKVGASCKGAEGACVDKDTALLCVDGKWAEVECRGTIGCMKSGLPVGTGPVECAHDKAEAGEACEDEDEATCSGDKKQMLKCQGHTWKVQMECSGVHGCVNNAKEVNCTGGIDKEGAACDEDGTYSCTPDQSKMLVCKGKKMVVAAMCKGQNKCRLSGKAVNCDYSLGDVGDPCEDKMIACSMDKKAFLECKGGTYVKKSDCKQCTPFLDHIDCSH